MKSEMATTIERIKRIMTSWGWSNGGGAGSSKRGESGLPYAEHGSRIWAADFERACDQSEREAILDELERRRKMNKRFLRKHRKPGGPWP